MSAFECQETAFQLWAIDRLMQKLRQKDPALPNHERHVNVEIARLATNIPHRTCLDIGGLLYLSPIVRAPGHYKITFNGLVVPILTLGVDSLGPPFCHICHVVLVTEAEAYSVPARAPLHWKALCRAQRSMCRPCHELSCFCGAPSAPGLVYAMASYEK